MSPNSERFQPPKLWKAIGTGIGTLTPTMPIWMRLEIARDVAVAGEDRDPVAVFVVVDELGRMIEIGAAHAREHRPEDLLPVDPHLRLDLVEQAAVEEEPILVALQFEAAVGRSSPRGAAARSSAAACSISLAGARWEWANEPQPQWRTSTIGRALDGKVRARPPD